MKLRCLIVDDEPIAREGLLEYISQVDFLEVAGSCENAVKANSFLKKEPVDLMLLDIQMPKVSGIELLRELKNAPQVILTTAYPNFALEGYALNVTDYLVKPFAFARFLQAMNKAYELYKLRQKSVEEGDHIFIKCDSRFEKIPFSSIHYIEGAMNYVTFHTTNGRFITYLTMKSVEQQLPPSLFMRVHKSYIVHLPKVQAIEGNELVIEKKKIPMSRERRDEVVNQLLGSRILKRE